MNDLLEIDGWGIGRAGRRGRREKEVVVVVVVVAREGRIHYARGVMEMQSRPSTVAFGNRRKLLNP
jgi:hypothetical protein